MGWRIELVDNIEPTTVSETIAPTTNETIAPTTSETIAPTASKTVNPTEIGDGGSLVSRGIYISAIGE